MSDRFVTVMISCPERDAIRAQTLANLAKTDWPDQVLVSMDDGGLDDPRARQAHNAKSALQLGLASQSKYILFLEDDLEFNRHLWHNLTHWECLSYVTMASLYNPNIREILRRPEYYFFEAEPEAIYGSQAYLFSRMCAEYIVKHWGQIPGMQDIQMSRLAAKLGKPIFYFIPSLVQHVGKESTFGGRFHWTQDFDAGFKI
jgi:hypothetical protein